MKNSLKICITYLHDNDLFICVNLEKNIFSIIFYSSFSLNIFFLSQNLMRKAALKEHFNAQLSGSSGAHTPPTPLSQLSKNNLGAVIASQKASSLCLLFKLLSPRDSAYENNNFLLTASCGQKLWIYAVQAMHNIFKNKVFLHLGCVYPSVRDN